MPGLDLGKDVLRGLVPYAVRRTVVSTACCRDSCVTNVVHHMVDALVTVCTCMYNMYDCPDWPSLHDAPTKYVLLPLAMVVCNSLIQGENRRASINLIPFGFAI